MVYVPNREHDIFVSYARVDDFPLPGASLGWVTTLVGALKIKLAQLLGRSDAYDLWIDNEDLSHHVGITSQITDALRNTAVMIPVLSPGYLASEWCQHEKRAFLDLVKKGEWRVFLIERYPLESGERPTEFQDLKEFRFWVWEPSENTPRTFGEPVPRTDDISYFRLVDELARELAGELKRLKSVEHRSSGAAAQPDQPSVLLAEVTDDLDQERAGVRSYLDQFGANVLPYANYPADPSHFQDAVKRDLAQCKAFVQLLSGVAGKKPRDLPQGYSKLQFDLATTLKKPIFQWRSPSLDVSTIPDQAHRLLVDGQNVLATSIEDFKTILKKSILDKPDSPPRKGLSAFVFVDIEKADRPLADRVCKILGHNGIGYSLPLEKGDPSDIRRDLEGNLLECDGIIIIYGCATVIWVRRQLLQCQKILSMRERPLQAFAVFEGPPEEKCEIDLKLPQLQVLDFRKDLEETELEKELSAFFGRLGKEEV
jgi:hypothetical protein